MLLMLMFAFTNNIIGLKEVVFIAKTGINALELINPYII